MTDMTPASAPPQDHADPPALAAAHTDLFGVGITDAMASARDTAALDEEGEPDRAYLGIDGTMGDAQDVAHPFIGSVYGEHCRVCGLARSYRRHTDREAPEWTI